jgi:hypothetical protein
VIMVIDELSSGELRGITPGGAHRFANAGAER